jgi:hypothetical protein
MIMADFDLRKELEVMKMTWISVPLKIEEQEALHLLAEREFRNTRLQAALIIRQELERRGLIQPEESPKVPNVQPTR